MEGRAMSNLAYRFEEVTYKDYFYWDDDKRYEIIDGIAQMMTSPSLVHQTISGDLMVAIWTFLKGKPCQVLTAPFDVRLFPKEDLSDTTVVQPDILVVCDPAKLADGKACKGAPDLVIEIISDSSAVMDRKVKTEKYREAGVKEYWIVNPETLEVLVNVLTGGHYVSTAYRDSVPSSILPGLKIDLQAVRGNVYT